MTDVSNVKINKGSNIERLNFRVTKIENHNIEKISLYQGTTMRIGKIASGAECRMDE